MKMKLFVTLTLTLSLGLILTLAIAYAQGLEREPGEEESGGTISVLGVANPPPAGYSVLYMFTGVANDDTDNDKIATAVHCTNYGSSAVTVTVELFTSGSTGSPAVFASPPDTLSPSETGTYSSQGTIFTEVPIGAGAIEQGSGRVLATASTLICTAQLLNPSPISPAITPTFMVKLPMFDSAGNPSPGSGVGSVFLPVILK
ncbi:MAG: hypothetical protein L6R45_17415 [Anaerolineae bacterium]|nr:hypothetical protein [Anaerolineae bacterium]